jgi:hypothetical protein
MKRESDVIHSNKCDRECNPLEKPAAPLEAQDITANGASARMKRTIGLHDIRVRTMTVLAAVALCVLFAVPVRAQGAIVHRREAALLHGGFERGDGAVVESFTQRARNRLARVCAFG